MTANISYITAYRGHVKRSDYPIKEPIFKFGGSPVFFREIDWPKCSTCNQDMDFLGQIPLDYPAQFSTRYACAYIFMCPGKYDERGWLVCPTWLPNSGANRVILQGKSDMSIWRFHKSEYPDYEITLEYLQEPLIDVSIAIDLEEEILQAVYYETKLAGVPAWLQENETPLCPICAGSMEFLAQIDAELDGPLPASSQEWDSGKYKMFKFGDVGLGYVFICEAECSPDSASFLWQC